MKFSTKPKPKRPTRCKALALFSSVYSETVIWFIFVVASYNQPPLAKKPLETIGDEVVGKMLHHYTADNTESAACFLKIDVADASMLRFSLIPKTKRKQSLCYYFRSK